MPPSSSSYQVAIRRFKWSLIRRDILVAMVALLVVQLLLSFTPDQRVWKWRRRLPRPQ